MKSYRSFEVREMVAGIVGFIFGSFATIIIMSLAIAAKEEDDEMSEMWLAEHKDD